MTYTPEQLRESASQLEAAAKSESDGWTATKFRTHANQLRAHAAALEELAALREQLAERDAEIKALKRLAKEMAAYFTDRERILSEPEADDDQYYDPELDRVRSFLHACRAAYPKEIDA